jgi:hypothetical protein
MRIVGLVFCCAVLAGCNQTSGTYRLPDQAPIAGVGRIERLSRTQVPFPPGEWILLARQDSYTRFGGSINPNQKAEDRTYGRVEGGRLVALFGFWTNTTTPNSGYVPEGGCTQGQVGTQKVYTSDLHGNVNSFDCVIVWPMTYSKPNNKSSDYYTEFYDAAQKYNLPTRGIAARVEAGYSLNDLTVTLTRFPERDGIADGNWTLGQEGPRERAYIQELLAWAQGFRPAVVRGTKGQL